MSVETQIIEDWLYETFTGDVTLTGLVGNQVYALQAPQNKVYPFVLFAPQNPRDINTLGARGAVRALMLIKAVNEGNSTPQEIADRIDALLDGQQVTHQGKRLCWRREQIVEYPETPAGTGIRYNHLGGLYRCLVR